MAASPRIPKPRVLASASLAVLACALAAVWAVVDSSAPQGTLVELTDNRLEPELGARVLELARDLANTRPEGKSVGEATRVTSAARNPSAMADELAALAAKYLRWMEPGGAVQQSAAPPEKVTDDAWPHVLDAVRLEVWGLERLLTEGESDTALRTAETVLDYCAQLRAAVASLSGFMMGRSCQQLVVDALGRGIDEKRWREEQLEAIAKLPTSSEWASQLERVLRTDYGTVSELAQQQLADSTWPASAYLYHPNRTARAWADMMAPVFMALHTRDIAEAYDVMVQQLSGLSMAPIGRNAGGFQAIASATAAYPTLIAQTQNAAMSLRLLNFRATLELYRRRNNSWPRNEDELAQILGGSLPSDPWQRPGGHLRYDTNPARLYSVGPNRRDDGGQYDASFSLSNLTDDYGIRLPD